MIHYVRGQEYKPHCDAYDSSSDHGKANCRRGGNRLVTVLLYLSDVEQGGSTSFTHLGLACPAKKGRVLVFYNMESGKVDPRAPSLCLLWSLLACLRCISRL